MEWNELSANLLFSISPSWLLVGEREREREKQVFEIRSGLFYNATQLAEYWKIVSVT